MLELIKGFLEYGLVGLIATLALWGFLIERKENKGLRERMLKMEREHSEDMRKAAERYTSVVDALRKEQEDRVVTLAGGFRDALTAADQKHHDQEDELTERLIKASETYADKTGSLMEKNGQLTEQLTSLVASIKRRGG
jgi:hypothetical protein